MLLSESDPKRVRLVSACVCRGGGGGGGGGGSPQVSSTSTTVGDGQRLVIGG